jgi:hypothetical protein
MFSETTLINAPLYLLMGIALTLMMIGVLIWAEARSKRLGTKGAKRVFQAVLAVTIVVMASTLAFGLMVEYQGDQFDYVYTATVEGGQTQGVVYIPTSNNTELQEKIHVVSGDGRMSLVDTEHGRAIKLVFNGDVSLEGKIVTREWLFDWEPTMLDENEDVWVMLDSPYTSNGTIEIDLMLANYNLPGHDELYYLRTPLRSGWELYDLGHKQE